MLYVKLNCVGHRFNPDVSNLNVSASSQEATFLSAAVTVEKVAADCYRPWIILPEHGRTRSLVAAKDLQPLSFCRLMESVLVILWNLPTIIVNHDKSADITGPLHSYIVFLPAKWKNESITRTQPAAALPTIQSCRKMCWGRVGLIDAESFSYLPASINELRVTSSVPPGDLSDQHRIENE